MSFSPLLDELILALRCLPGVGPKSAQRMALHLLEREREGAANLTKAINRALAEITHCESCRNFSETPLCQICQQSTRDVTTLCIVESPADVFAIEQTGAYRGLYFVLMGHLSPLDGIGPQNLGLPILFERCQVSALREVILATNLTVEGEATAHYIANMLQPLPLRVSRIAHGVPTGGELEYVDGGTLARALQSRANVG